MKTQEKAQKVINKNQNYFTNRLLSLNGQLSSELKFIVPWIQVDKSSERNCKNKLEH